MNMVPQRILIIKPSSLGDVVHALPVLADLRSQFPHAYIAWLVKTQWADVLQRTEGLDQVWSVDRGLMNWLREIPSLRRERFDVVIDLQGLFRSGAMAWLSGTKTRVGFASGREGSPWFYTHKIPVPTPDMHAVDRYRLVSSSLGYSTQGAPKFCLTSSTKDRESVSSLLSRKGVASQTPWVALCVSARWPTKQWPSESFADLADHIQHELDVRVVLIGSPDDRPIASLVEKFTKTHPVNLVGETGVEILPALLESATLLVTNDSGPMHIAAAVGTRVVAIFGPTNPMRTGPYGEGHDILTNDIVCRPCYSRICQNQIPMECLTGISPDKVLEVVRQQLSMRLVH